MKIPKKIKILGYYWEVISDEKGKSVIYDGNCFGSTHLGMQKIFIEHLERTTQQLREQSFLHEILHAIWWQTGLGKRKDVDNKLEEEIIHPLAQGLYQVLKDNKLKFD